MKLTFLGTGTSQGVPVIGCTCDVCRSLDARDKRLRTSVHLQIGDLSIVIDPGPDFRQQMLRAGLNKLDAVIITHEHKDHTGGLDDIRAYNFIQGKPMPVYAWPRVLNYLRNEYAYIFNSSYPGIPKIELIAIEDTKFNVLGLDIEAIDVLHAQLPVMGVRLGNVAYITDANYISSLSIERLKGLDTLVLNALQQTHHISHFNLAEALQIVNQLQPKKTYFTHISHNMGLHRHVEPTLPDNVRLAYDMLQLH